ncbi:MAG: hypothetical protein WDN28_05045 [Chthoniobacter sp.]
MALSAWFVAPLPRPPQTDHAELDRIVFRGVREAFDGKRAEGGRRARRGPEETTAVDGRGV